MKRINKLIICSFFVAIAFVTSKIKLLEFLFPLGGSITLFSMLFLIVPSYLYGLKYGLITTFCFSMLKFIFASDIYHPVQGILDYFLSYICFSIGGINKIRMNKFGLSLGLIFGCILRTLFASLSGYIFFKEYTPAGFNPILYVIVYNGSYIFIELILSLIIVNIRSINKFFKNKQQ